MDSESQFLIGKLAYGVIEAAHVAGVGRSTLYEALGSGQLKAVKLGRRTLITADELRRFINSLPPARRAEGVPASGSPGADSARTHQVTASSCAHLAFGTGPTR